LAQAPKTTFSDSVIATMRVLTCSTLLLSLIPAASFFPESSCGRPHSLLQLQALPTTALSIVPYPKDVRRVGGMVFLSYNTSVRFVGEAGEQELFAMQLLTDRFDELRQTSNRSSACQEQTEVVLELRSSVGGPEAYSIKADGKSAVSIVAAEPAGLFYGAQTFVQLVDHARESASFSLPAVEITDEPRFGWRGMMVDSVRHFLAPADLKRFIDTIALLKYNRLHWHLTDDQGFRFEVPSWPLLALKGSGQDRARENLTGNAARPEMPFYTREEMKDIVAYAALRHITVVPEIDFPGHATAAIVAYPELGNDDVPGWRHIAPKNVPVERFIGDKVWGVYQHTLQPSERSLKFLEDLLDVVLDVFPSEHIHIGGDEAPHQQWDNSKRAQDALVQLHRKRLTHHQSYFTAHLSALLLSRGRIPLAWDEVLSVGGAPQELAVTAWRSPNELRKSLSKGHQTIFAVSEFVYFDRYQSEEKKEPKAICCHLPLEKVYGVDIFAHVAENKEHLIKGGQAQLWSEYLENFKKMEYMAHPRSLALAEVLWSPRGFNVRAGAYDNFLVRLKVRLEDFARRGINFRHQL